MRGCLGVAMAVVLAPMMFSQPNVGGTWSPLGNWPLIPLHVILTLDGRILSYGTTASGQQTGKFIYDVWNPKAGGIAVGHTTLPNNTRTDLFCSAQLNLADGRILIAGGDNYVNGATTNTGNPDLNIFDPSNNSLVAAGSMNRPRWYGSMTTLPNGSIYVQGGRGGPDLPELWTGGVSTLLSAADTSALNWFYPRNYVAPDGRIFGLDANGTMYYVNTAGGGQITTVGTLAAGNYGTTSSGAMFLPGKILQLGDGAGALVIDITNGTPVVTATASMAGPRMWLTATILPDGKVLATGGSAADNQLVGVDNTAAIWNPATGKWTIGPQGAVARLYHSTAILLPDATVLVGGGGAPGPLVNTNAQIYYPPYLYTAAGALAKRPTITAAPATLEVAKNFSVTWGGTATRITKVSMIKTGSVTHSVNMEQRFLPLNFTASGNNLTITGPANANVATPGYYLLFVFNESNVPSEAKIIKINAPAVPPVTDATIGNALGPGYGPVYSLMCNSGETLVGIAGTGNPYLNSIAPMCVAVNAQGAWTSSPQTRGVSAGTPAGASFSKTCPVNQGVGRFQGLAGSWVDQVQIACQPLTSASTVTGTPVYQTGAGGAGGAPAGPYGCPGGAAFGIRGIAGTYVGSFGLACSTVTDATIGAALGPGWGPSFTLACQSGEVLAGITGGAGSYVDRVGPLCVAVNAQGNWAGSPVARGVAGGAGDTAFTKTCPVNQAVAQYRGSAGSWVDQIEISCQALASPSSVTGSPSFQGPVGGQTGSPVGPYGCPGSPAYGVRGIAGTYVGNFGLYCTKP